MFKDIGHFFTAVSQYIVKGAKAVATVEAKVAAEAPLIENLSGIFFAPAVPIEDLAFRLFGDISHAVSESGDTITAKGLNYQLDAQTVADIKALIPEIEAFAQRIGVVKPAPTPATPVTK